MCKCSRLFRYSSRVAQGTIDAHINAHGTKAGAMLFVVRALLANKENKIIVFSQWGGLLSHLGMELKNGGTQVARCVGNVHMRNKAISSFSGVGGGGPRVILLSLENAASGTNLTEATHVILADPVPGTWKHTKAVEAQAIGRAHRQGQKKRINVIRLITNGTIEAELHRAQQQHQG